MIASGQYTRRTRIDASVVDLMRKNALTALLNKSKRLCHRLTALESLSNHLGRTTKSSETVDLD